MERILTSAAMRMADKYTIEKLGIPEDVLIERAGVAVAEAILKRFKGGRVLVAIGKGNNGEDGKIIARILSERHGFAVTCCGYNSTAINGNGQYIRLTAATADFHNGCH